MDIKSKVLDVLSKKCDVSNLSDDSNLLSLGLDSLDLVECILELETTFNVEFDNNEITDIKTLNDVVKLIEKKIQ